MSITNNINIILNDDKFHIYIKNIIKKALTTFTKVCNNPNDSDTIKYYFFFINELYNVKSSIELQNYILNTNQYSNFYEIICKIILKLHGSSTTYSLINNNKSNLFLNLNEFNNYKLNCRKNGGYAANNNKNNIKNIRKKIYEIEKYIIQYIENINTTNILTYKNDLDGISDNILIEIQKQNENIADKFENKLHIKLTKKFYNECMSFLKKSIVRKKINIVLNSFFSKLSHQIISLIIFRHDLSIYLKYNNYSDLVNSFNTIQYPNIYSNILKISSQINNKYFDEYASICKTDSLNYWDIYYSFNILKEKININENNIREYFPVTHVFQYILNLYQILFDIKIQKDESENIDKIYHESYLISYNNDNIGTLNINFFANTIENSDLKIINFNYNVFYILTNYSERLYKKNILLYTSDVINLMREIGCIFIHMLHETTYHFLTQKEIPNVIANLFEFLFWNKNIIRYISSHYVSTQKLPDIYYNKLMKIKNIDIAFNYKYLCFVSLYDYFIYNNDNFYNLCKKIIFSNSEPHELNQSNKFDDVLKKEYIDPNEFNKQTSKEYIVLEELYKKLFDKIYNIDGINIIHNLCSVPTNSNFYVGKNVGLYYRILFDSVLALKIYQKEFIGVINKSIGTTILDLYKNSENILNKYDLSIDDDEINYFNTEYSETKRKSDNFINFSENDDNFSIIESITNVSESSEYQSDCQNRLNYFCQA